MSARARVVSVAAGLLLLAGCALMDPITEMRISSTDAINPDSSERASPLVIRVYQLSSGDSFREADFYDLYDDAEAVLGEELIAGREIVLRPGDEWNDAVNLDDETRYIGMLGAFRDIRESDWRVLESVDPNDGRPIDFIVDGRELKRAAN